MARYHINPTTGEASACRAKIRCPFMPAQDHYASLEEARAQYEAIMSGATPPPLTWLLSDKGQTLTGPENSRAFVQALHAEYQTLKSRLTEDQQDHLRNYTQFGFERVNRLLRGLPFPNTDFEELEEAVARTKEQVNGLDEVFAISEKKPKIVYRFMSASEGLTVRESVEAISDRGTFQDPAYLSTSASVDYPLYEILEHPKEPLFLLEIATSEGVVVQPKDHNQPGHTQSMENEILLPRNTEFEVAGVDLRKRVAFGGMKEALIAHGNVWKIRDRRSMQNKPYHVMPVVKLVQRERQDG